MKRLYLDTSVFGGCFDKQFQDDSLKIINAIREGKCFAVVSDLVVNEISLAPQRVVSTLNGLPETYIEKVQFNHKVGLLREAYLDSGILTGKSVGDATHVAFASIAEVDAIVSWNFKHIVNLDKIKLFNRINVKLGYNILAIVSPMEVFFDD